MADTGWWTWLEENRISWNAATAQHNTHKGDQAAFFRAGGNTLYPEEIALLGGIRGKTLLHLQCNAGQDTLSIAAHLGATVTGVDISDEAIAFARRLAADSGIPASFIRSDAYDWFRTNQTHYDVVFSSYGALPWLADLPGWGQGVAAALKPGGHFVLVEFHPALAILDGALTGDWSQGNDYMGGTHYAFPIGIGDYVADAGGTLPNTEDYIPPTEPYVNPNPSHEFSWGIADTVTALLDAGLRLTALREYPYSNGFRPYANMVQIPGGRWTFADEIPVMPLMFAVRAERDPEAG